jgi:hypothetical protein
VLFNFETGMCLVSYPTGDEDGTIRAARNALHKE